MKKNSLSHWLLALVMMLIGTVSQAQVRFTTPLFPNMRTDFAVAVTPVATVAAGYVPISPSAEYQFSVTVWRSTDNIDEGYVGLFSGVNSPDFQLATTGSTATTPWTSSGGEDSHFLRGTLNTSSIPAGHTKLYAVFFHQDLSPGTRGEVSEPITLVPTRPTPPVVQPPTAANRTEYCVGFGDYLNQTMTARFSDDPLNDSGLRIIWHRRYENTDWEEVSTSKLEYGYTPPQDLVLRPTYYMANIQERVFREWWWRWENTYLYGNSQYFTFLINAHTPTPTAPSYVTCGNPITLAVNGTVNSSLFRYTWTAPDGWSINGGPSVAGASNIIQLTPPAGVPAGNYRVLVNAAGDCGPRTSDAIIDVIVNYNSVQVPNASFSVTRYDGCRKYYGVVMQTVPGVGIYTYSASTNIGYGGSIQTDQHDGGYITIPLDIEPSVYGMNDVTLTVQAAGQCGSSALSTTGPFFLSGPDPGCDGGGGGTSDAQTLSTLSTTSYPNPVSDMLYLPANATVVRFTNDKGLPIQVSPQGGRINVQKVPSGLYVVSLQVGKKVVTQHIQIVH